MSISSLLFLCVFFPLILLFYYCPILNVLKNNGRISPVFLTSLRNIILLAAGLGMYALAQPLYIPLLILSLLLNYFSVRLMTRFRLRVLGTVVIIADVLVLFFFKYIGLAFLKAAPSYGFPVGLSFFTFREISYVIDSMNADDDKQKENRGFINTALYITCFITIYAGPLGSYNKEIGQISSRETDPGIIYTGLLRIVIGILKKVLIADSLMQFVNLCFAANSLSVAAAWVASVFYTLELYFDFSGYTDIAIGIGNVFGFKFSENFDLPYTAVSICDFWKRWHISLTKWFTEYIYFPLGGSRVRTHKRHIFNLFVVWLCTGIWHGSGMNYIIWAMIYFLFQTIEKYTGLESKLKKLHLGHFYTLMLVNLNWVIFRCETMNQAIRFIGNMFGYSASGFMDRASMEAARHYLLPFILGILFASGLPQKLHGRFVSSTLYRNTVRIALILLFAVSVTMMISRGYTAPLYGSF